MRPEPCFLCGARLLNWRLGARAGRRHLAAWLPTYHWTSEKRHWTNRAAASSTQSERFDFRRNGHKYPICCHIATCSKPGGLHSPSCNQVDLRWRDNVRWCEISALSFCPSFGHSCVHGFGITQQKGRGVRLRNCAPYCEIAHPTNTRLRGIRHTSAGAVHPLLCSRCRVAPEKSSLGFQYQFTVHGSLS